MEKKWFHRLQERAEKYLTSTYKDFRYHTQTVTTNHVYEQVQCYLKAGGHELMMIQHTKTQKGPGITRYYKLLDANKEQQFDDMVEQLNDLAMAANSIIDGSAGEQEFEYLEVEMLEALDMVKNAQQK